MATFGKTRFASHINFLGTCLRRNVIPRGFKLNFHVQTNSDFHFRRDTSRYLRSCSFRLMRSTIRSMVRKKAGFDRIIQDQGSLLFNTLPEAGEVRFLIHIYNRRLHNFLLDSKAKTLASLLPDTHSTHTPPSDDIRTQNTKLVVTIPPDLELSSPERSVLAKGLNFVPLNPLPDEFSIRKDVASFCRKLRLRQHFGITNQPDNTSPEDFLNSLGSTRSSWTPKAGENDILDSVIDSINKDVDCLLPPKKTTLSNLSSEEQEALLSLKRNKNLIIKPADKGGAVVVWQKDLYVAEANKQLSDQTAYNELPSDPTSDSQALVKNTLTTLIRNNQLPKSATSLLHPCPQISNFYLLPKIHKANNPGRPIVSSHSCPTVLISEFLDSVLFPLVSALPSFVQDTPHFLRLIQDFEFPENCGERLLFTMDVSSLYTSIPHHAALSAIRYYLDQRPDPQIPTTTFLRLTELVLTQNCFQFNGRYFRQVKGVAMGTKMGPSVACLTMGHFEEQLFSQYTGAQPFLYKRYIDDIVGVATGTRQDLESFIQFVGSFCPFLKFTHCISDTSVVFLDLQLSICDRKIQSNLHFKPTDSHNYLLYPSNHPKSCTKSIPYSQLLRARRICSEDSDFSAASKDILSFFEKRQYPSKILTNALHKIQGINRAEALSKKSNTSTNLRIPLVISHHPSVRPIIQAIYKNVETLRQDPSTRDLFPEPPITAYRVEKNISKHLVRASHPQQSTANTPGTFPCNRVRCNTCPVVSKNTLLNIVGPNGNKFTVNQHFTCTSQNVVYILVCGRCNSLYVGETKRRLADRVTEHLRSIRQNLQGYPVASHFNPPSPCSIMDLTVTAAIMCRGSDRDRLSAENRLIMKLGTLSPHGLNVRMDLF